MTLGYFRVRTPQISGMIYRYCVSVAGVTAQHVSPPNSGPVNEADQVRQMQMNLAD